jgi:hypothetical protein
MPEAHADYKDATVERNHRWAKRIGPNTAQVVHAIEQSKAHGEQGQRL